MLALLEAHGSLLNRTSLIVINVLWLMGSPQSGSLLLPEYHRAAFWVYFSLSSTLMTCHLFCLFVYLIYTPIIQNVSSVFFVWPLLLQTDLNFLTNWSSPNHLSCNASKCGLLRFSNWSHSLLSTDYQLNGKIIPCLEQCKVLGVVFSSNLSWSHHYSAITANVYCKLGLIRHTFSISTPANIKKQLYLSLVRSQLSYCSPVWRPHLIKDIKSIESIQHCTANL